MPPFSAADRARRPAGPYLLFSVITVFVAYDVLAFIYGPRVPTNHGLGWDGIIYGRLVEDFFGPALDQLTHYSLNRILPSLILYLSGQISGVELNTPDRIILAFFIFDVSVTAGTVCLLWAISRRLAQPAPVYLMVCIGFLLSFGHFRMVPFYPALTDTAAVFLGTLAVYAYMKSSLFLLSIVMVASYYTWPIGTVLTILLVAWPRQLASPGCARGVRWSGSTWQTLLWALMIVVVLALVVYVPKPAVVFSKGYVPGNLYVNVSLVFVFVGFVAISAPPIGFRDAISRVDWTRLGIALALFAALVI